MTSTIDRPATVLADPPLRRRGERLEALAQGDRVQVPPMDPDRARSIVEALARSSMADPVGTAGRH